MSRSILITLLLSVAMHCQSCSPRNTNMTTTDSIVYNLQSIDSKVCFVSKENSVCFSKKYKSYKTDSSAFSIEVDSRVFYIDNRVELSYSLDDTLYHYSGTSYLDLPYGQFYIDKGAYSNQKITCTVLINKQPNKDEKKLTKGDWKKAEKRRKEPINFLEIVDTESKIVYASASRVTSPNGEVQYAVKISEQCPEKSRILFKGALFMILWIYQSNQN